MNDPLCICEPEMICEPFMQLSILLKKLSRSSLPDVFCKKSVLRNFAKFTGKHLCQNLFFNEVACLGVSSIMFSTTLLKRDSQACSFMKKETLAQMISCEFFEIFRTLFLKNTSGSCFWIYFFQAGL